MDVISYLLFHHRNEKDLIVLTLYGFGRNSVKVQKFENFTDFFLGYKKNLTKVLTCTRPVDIHHHMEESVTPHKHGRSSDSPSEKNFTFILKFIDNKLFFPKIYRYRLH